MAKKINKKHKKVAKGDPQKILTKKSIKKRSSEPQWFPTFFSAPYIPIAAIFLSIGLYFMTFNYGYILDDQVFLSKNEFVKQGVPGIGKIFTEEAMTGYFKEQKNLITGARYRPLSMVTFALEYEMFELKPGLSHIINAILYGITAALLFYICRLFWPKEDEKPWYYKIGFWAAIIFIVHPLHTEVVANIKGRDEIMALLFSLWTLIAAFKAKKPWHYLIVGLLFYLALLSKENSLTFMAVIPMAIYTFRKNRISKKEWVMLFAALALVAFGYLLQRRLVIGYWLSSGVEITELLNNPFIDMNGSEKYATIFYTLIKYIQLLVWPHPLSHDYYPYAIATRNWSDIFSILSLVLHFAMGIWAVINIRKRKPMAFFILTYLATLSIVSNIPFTVGATMNERFIYMPSIAFVLMVPYIFFRLIKSNKALWKKIGLGVMSVMVVAYAAVTVLRIPVWENSIALNRSAVKAYPNSARSNLFMGTALFNEAEATTDYEEKKRLFAESRDFIEKSLEIHPIYGNALKMKAGVAAKLFQMDYKYDKLFDVFTEVLLVKPGTRYVHQYLEYLTKQGNSRQQLMDFYYRIGFEEFGQKRGMYSWAEKFLNYGFQLDPNDKRNLRALSITYDNLGKTDRANEMRARMNQ